MRNCNKIYWLLFELFVMLHKMNKVIGGAAFISNWIKLLHPFEKTIMKCR